MRRVAAERAAAEDAEVAQRRGRVHLSGSGSGSGVELRVGGVSVRPHRANAAGERLGDVAALRPRDRAGQDSAPVLVRGARDRQAPLELAASGLPDGALGVRGGGVGGSAAEQEAATLLPPRAQGAMSRLVT